MKRRALLVGLGCALLARPARAQGGATQAQIDLAIAFVSLAALRTRYGDAHPDVVAARARVDGHATTLGSAIARREVIDVAAVTSALEAALADVRARLAEFSQRCGSGHPDMQSALARREALEDALAHVTSDGVFLPP